MMRSTGLSYSELEVILAQFIKKGEPITADLMIKAIATVIDENNKAINNTARLG